MVKLEIMLVHVGKSDLSYLDYIMYVRRLNIVTNLTFYS